MKKYSSKYFKQLQSSVCVATLIDYVLEENSEKHFYMLKALIRNIK